MERDLFQTVVAYLTDQRLLEPGATVVMGVSGGPDSVVLLHLLHRLAGAWDLRLHVAHLHHGLRGPDADADAEFVAALAAEWGLPCTVERADVPGVARREQLAVEETARRLRYAFLARVALQVGATRIAVAHHADDQAETVLMHLLRGAGPAGLRGMLPATPLGDYRLLPLAAGEGQELAVAGLLLIRPLLAVTRAEIEAYARAAGLAWRVDRSNLDTTFFRNRLRHEVLPALAQVTPGIAERFCHLAEVVRADYELLETLVERAWSDLLVERYPDALVFDLAGFRAQPLSLRRALIRRAAYGLRRTLRDVDFVHVENAVTLAQRGVTGQQATLPRGLLLTVGYTTLTVATADALPRPPERPWLEPGTALEVAVPGVTALPGGWVLEATLPERWSWEEIVANADPFTAWTAVGAAGGVPMLRTRRPGDRFCPQGLGGAEVNLGDFLINVKVPRPWRDALPLLAVGDQVIWVVGVRLSETVLVRPESWSVVRWRIRKQP